MPQATAARRLSGYRDFPCAKVNYRQSGRLFTSARWSPFGLLARISAAYRGPGAHILCTACDLSVPHNGQSHFVFGNDRLVRYPFVLGFGIQRPQPAAVGKYRPGSLRSLAAGFPTKNDLAGYPRICLYVSDLKWDRNDVLDS